MTKTAAKPSKAKVLPKPTKEEIVVAVALGGMAKDLMLSILGKKLSSK